MQLPQPTCPALRVLIADSDERHARKLAQWLRTEGHDVVLTEDGMHASDWLGRQAFDLILAELALPKRDGWQLLHQARQQRCGTHIVLLSEHPEVDEAVDVMKAKATDYLRKPVAASDVRQVLESVRKQTIPLEAVAPDATAGGADDALGALIGEAPAMVRLRQRIQAMAEADGSVLITGESGTGKELVARSLHERNVKRHGPFVAVNCAAVPETLLEAELFGHERGAFTGAVQRRAGRLEAARGGTLFLDEIGDMPLAAQAKLLRVLEQGSFERLGSDRTLHADSRIVAATNAKLKERVAAGRFREDLYFRIKVFHLFVPPLRERLCDLARFVAHFYRVHAGDGRSLPPLTPAAWGALCSYTYPGNVRELEHAIRHAVVMSRGATIDVEHLPEDVVEGLQPPTTWEDEPSLDAAIWQFERQYLLSTLRATQGRKVQAARRLGISRKALWSKLKRFGIGSEEIREVCSL